MQPQSMYGGQTGMPPTGQPPAPRKKSPKTLLIPLVVTSVLTLLFLGLFIWAFMERSDYKDNVDAKVEQAVKVAVQQESQRKDNEFAEKEKLPNKTFKGPDTFGALTFDYPKTWSAYVVDKGNGNTPLEGYFHPNVVPDVSGNTAFALHIKIIDKPYDQQLKSLESKVKQGKITVTAFSPEKQSSVTGVRVEGEVNTGQQNFVILLPLRDKTIEVATESAQFKGDFEAIIKNLNFIP